MAVNTYSPEKIDISIAGTIVTGYMDGTFINIEREVDTFTKQVGADGEVARTKSANRSGMITLTLMGTSTSNDLLSALHIADENTLTGKFPVQVRDTNGTTIAFTDTAWIENYAPIEFAQEVSGREWRIACANLNMFVGGND